MSGNELPKIIDKTHADIEAAIVAINSSNIPSGTKDFAISCIRLAVWLPNALLEQKIKLSNLRKLLFGRGKKNKNKDEKDTKDVELSEQESSQSKEKSSASLPDTINSEESDTPNRKKVPGHGRLAHSAYTDTIEHTLSITNFKTGDFCPAQCGGRLHHYKPGVLVRIKGQNLAAVHKYWIEKLRCGSCGVLVSADIPEDVGDKKYDATFKSILALQKYYVATPFYRQTYFQSLLKLPLPVSTQWQLIEEVGCSSIIIFKVLEKMAANGDIVHNDDTHVKIIDMIRQHRLNPSAERTGVFTTGIMSRTDKHDIALFYNGTSHAGENLERLLEKRDAHNNEIIQMCDALSRNLPKAIKTILCNCLSHGLRKFDDLKEFYPVPCLHIIQEIAKVYDCDEQAKKLSKQQRLEYHQEHSDPIMKSLHEYISNQLETKQVEPNESLGQAMRYMLKHWHALTQFLRILGAPLDNNILERALKIPIRGRRTWLFYKTQYGAMIGGVLTSIIYTCAMASVNPLTYLTALQEHKEQIVKEPERWLPWNYQGNLTTSLASAA